MANANLLGTAEIKAVFDSRLWGGVGPTSTDWLQSPMGSNDAQTTASMAVVELTIDDGDADSAYDITVATNPVTGTELLAVLGIFSTTAGANAVDFQHLAHSSTEIKWRGAGANGADTVYRLVFLYR